MMVAEKTHIILHNIEIRERRHLTIEVDSVIPKENIVCNIRPTLQSLHEILTAGIFCQRDFTVAVDVAKHHNHIWLRFDILGRIHRIKISQCRNFLIWETFGKLVHKINQTARRRTRCIVKLLTFRTGTVRIVTVVLAHTDDFLIRISLEDRIDSLGYDFEYFRIGKAPLCSRMTLPIEISIILRMFLAVFLYRKKAVEGMYPIIGCKDFIRLLQTIPPFV